MKLFTLEEKKYFKNCDYKAATQTSLKKHESTHHIQDNIECEISGEPDFNTLHGLS